MTTERFDLLYLAALFIILSCDSLFSYVIAPIYFYKDYSRGAYKTVFCSYFLFKKSEQVLVRKRLRYACRVAYYHESSRMENLNL